MDDIRGSLFKVFGVLGTASYFYPAPFGKFHRASRFNFDGRYGWLIQEIVGPLTFLYYLLTTLSEPLTGTQYLAAALFIIHYFNRAIIWPLYMMNSISPSHATVIASAALWQYLNGYLQACAVLRMYSTNTYSEYLGLPVFIIGMSGNIIHDKILADLRKVATGYGIPHGFLYEYISFPNYLCEWVEWFGYAWFIGQPECWWFLGLEIVVMLPRAMKGHEFYKATFGEDFPSNRKAILPFLL